MSENFCAIFRCDWRRTLVRRKSKTLWSGKEASVDCDRKIKRASSAERILFFILFLCLNKIFLCGIDGMKNWVEVDWKLAVGKARCEFFLLLENAMEFLGILKIFWKCQLWTGEFIEACKLGILYYKLTMWTFHNRFLDFYASRATNRIF